MKKELLAAGIHYTWSRWIENLFTKGKLQPDGSFLINPKTVARWMKQYRTSYCFLSDKEKDIDRTEADILMKLIKGDD